MLSMVYQWLLMVNMMLFLLNDIKLLLMVQGLFMVLIVSDNGLSMVDE